MGLFRYFLALIVLYFHCCATINVAKPDAPDGALAVQSFFIISGFYMALIFEKYRLQEMSWGNIKNFYMSRLLRIYPVYYVCLFITLVLFSFHFIQITPPSAVITSFNNMFDKIFYVFINLFLLGQDVIRFMIYDPHTRSLVFHPSNLDVNPIYWAAGLPIMGQAWTLSLEIMFYLLVPFILRKSTFFIVFLCLGGFAIKGLLLLKYGYNSSSLQNGFLPIELAVFLLGVLSYRLIYLRIEKNSLILKSFGWIFLCLIFLESMVFYHKIPSHVIKNYLFIALVTLAAPFLFGCFKKSKVDNWIGELSYPVYMTHFFCIYLLAKLVSPQYLIFSVIILSTSLSILMKFLIIAPVDKFRHRKFSEPGAKPVVLVDNAGISVPAKS